MELCRLKTRNLLTDTLTQCRDGIAARFANAVEAIDRSSPYFRKTEMEHAVALLSAQARVAASLAQAPHVRGVILTGAGQYAANGALGETAWEKSGHLIGVPDRAPSRERLADGPVALRAVPLADAGIQDAEVVVDLRDRPDRASFRENHSVG